MPTFSNDGLTLHYVDRGSGSPVLLLHGFGMSARSCWIDTGLVDRLAASGHRVLALDARGHGHSDKPTDPAAYDADRMMADVLACMQQAGIDSAPLVGHSMGGRTVLALLAGHGEHAKRSVVISNGGNVFEATKTGALADALETGETSFLPPPVAGFVRMLLEMGNDRTALAAYCRMPRPALTSAELATIATPVKVICGDRDPVVGDPAQLCAAIRNAELLIVAGREHTDVLASEELQDATARWLAPRRHDA